MGTIVDVPDAQKFAKSFDQTDKAKIDKITEICKVSAEEATRVLIACRMDETLAIDRFLSGEEKAYGWSQVSKTKKKPQQPFVPQRSGRSARHHNNGNRPPNTKHATHSESSHHHHHHHHHHSSNNNPRDDSSPSSHSFNHNHRHRANGNGYPNRRVPKAASSSANGHRRRRDPSSNHFQQAPAPSQPVDSLQKSFRLFNIDPSSTKLQPETQSAHTQSRDIWGPKSSKSAESGKSDATAPGEAQRSVPIVNGSSVHESPIAKLGLNQHLNYAAIVATSNDRPKPQPDITSSVPLTALAADPGDPAPAVSPALATQENTTIEPRVVDAEANSRPSPAKYDIVPDDAKIPSAIPLSDTAPQEESAPASNQGERTEPVVLQFGSFGFSSLNSSVWSRNEKVETTTSAPEAIPENATFHNTLETSSNSIPAVSNPRIIPDHAATASNLKQLEESALRKTLETNNNNSSSVADGTFPPVVAVGVTGAFPAPSFAPPYMMPPLPYASGLGAFEAGSELNSSRNPTVTPLTVYDPSNLGLANPNPSKMGSLPGLHDNYSLPSLPTPAKQHPHPTHAVQPGLPEQDKSNGLNSTTAVPGSLDAMYMIPSYSYMIPSYPSLQYGPPHGIAPHSHSHFAYAAMPQVNTAGGFNPYHTQSSNVTSNASKPNTHGSNVPVPVPTSRTFDDATQNAASISRNVVLMNDSSYAAANSYLSSTENNNNPLAKTIGDTSTFKSNNHRLVQGTMGTCTNFPGVSTNNLTHNGNGMGVPGPSPGNSAYDFSMNQTHASVQPNVGSIGVGGWNNRQAGTGQAEANTASNPPGYYPGGYY